jgi:hypothetical protein
MRFAERITAWPRAQVRAAFLIGLACCAIAPLLRPPAGAATAPYGAAALPRTRSEMPRQWDGRALRPLALSAVEQRFAAQFPGRVERLTDGAAVLVWRDVHAPTRMLHPAADCYRALGYRIEHAALQFDAQTRLWRCFEATPGATGSPRLRVCERIEDARGDAYTDASSWYWAALLGHSRGPWQAITITREL